MPTDTELEDRFRHHAPSAPEIGEGHQRVRESCLELALTLNRMLVDGREKAVAMTNLEEVMFWANASIARNQKVLDAPSDSGAEEQGT